MNLPKTPWPYYIDHLLIAGLISAVTYALGAGTVLGGAVFYAVREIYQRLDKGHWDWPGLLWPVVPLVWLEIMLRSNT